MDRRGADVTGWRDRERVAGRPFNAPAKPSKHRAPRFDFAGPASASRALDDTSGSGPIPRTLVSFIIFLIGHGLASISMLSRQIHHTAMGGEKQAFQANRKLKSDYGMTAPLRRRTVTGASTHVGVPFRRKGDQPLPYHGGRLEGYQRATACPVISRNERLETHPAVVCCGRKYVPGTIAMTEEEQHERAIGPHDFHTCPAGQTVLRAMQREHTDWQRTCRCPQFLAQSA
jgi:hypothetical protein